ncbi:TetR/AcrR family transcriptional regulator [Lipingzhangella sp. LS1_29]|uniref:TetR/AcrR family transcriptional regulator n=1 Tax=Lipingzhangella rawalii TaxID=2055835 RepID=A0ABU2H5A5_9ACTN|nr:TetR/AcrR family transcriptional regulator [Lipingzhangella rawalii]MDS1270039.1 TetR/AcrR family transcriptional regulator [Lipingzhangella rawalii]
MSDSATGTDLPPAADPAPDPTTATAVLFGPEAANLASTALTQVPLRRLPTQQRSRERVHRMLTACAELLDEGSYTALTTTRIAERAGVAIGSVYQFFPDRQAVARALALIHAQTLRSWAQRRLAEVQPTGWCQTVDAVLDAYIDMHRHAPGFRTLHFGEDVDARLLDVSETSHQVIVDLLRSVLGESLPEDCHLDRLIGVATQAADAVLRLAFRDTPQGQSQLLVECRILVRSYLAAHTGEQQCSTPQLAAAGDAAPQDQDDQDTTPGRSGAPGHSPPRGGGDRVATALHIQDPHQNEHPPGTMDRAGLFPSTRAATGE